MDKLLQNKIFISTRPEGQPDELSALFAVQGATLLEMPLIKIQPVKLLVEEEKIFGKLDKFQWLVFTSGNGVKYFFYNLEKIQGTRNLPQTLQVAVIGNKTEKVLNQQGFSAQFVNPGSTGEDFAKAFGEKLKTEKHKPNVLLALGNLARKVIKEELENYCEVARINLYETLTSETIDENIRKLILDDQYEMLLFTSPSGITGFLHHFRTIQKEKIRMACIGETTAKAASENHIQPVAIAENSSATGLFQTIINQYKNNKI